MAIDFDGRSVTFAFREFDTIVSAFVARGVTKVRLTGGEPLVRRDIMDLFQAIGERPQLDHALAARCNFAVSSR